MEEKVKGGNGEGRNGVKEKGKRGKEELERRKGKGERRKMQQHFTLRILLRVLDLAYYTSRALPCFRHSLMKSHELFSSEQHNIQLKSIPHNFNHRTPLLGDNPPY